MKYVGLSILLCLATSCAAKYQESSFLCAGYRTEKVSEEEFLVSFRSGLLNNSHNPAQHDQIIMTRAAELTLEHGYTHFTITPHWEESRVRCFRATNAPQSAFEAQEVLDFQKQSPLFSV